MTADRLTNELDVLLTVALLPKGSGTLIAFIWSQLFILEQVEVAAKLANKWECDEENDFN
jgi:hypothetical protein